MTRVKQEKLISSPHLPWTLCTVVIISMTLEVMKLIFAVLDVSFNSGRYTVMIKRQFLYINICHFLTIFVYMLALVNDFVRNKCSVT